MLDFKPMSLANMRLNGSIVPQFCGVAADPSALYLTKRRTDGAVATPNG
jgi:hypothetical protein